jgi:hypothetical protein
MVKKMMNSIRPDALASLHLRGEAKNGSRPVKGARKFRDLSLESAVSSKIGMHGVIGDSMVLNSRLLELFPFWPINPKTSHASPLVFTAPVALPIAARCITFSSVASLRASSPVSLP